MTGVADGALREAYQLRSKQARQQRLKEIYAQVAAECIPADAAPGYANQVNNLVFDLEAKIVRNQILSGEARIDGRDTRTVRPISIRTACSRARTARRCSPAARRRRWSSRRLAPRATSRSSTR